PAGWRTRRPRGGVRPCVDGGAMAGRSAAGRGSVLDEDASATAEEPLDAAPRRGGTRRPRAGAGGRWWVWVGRAVLWAFIIVVLFNGLWLPLRENFFPRAAQEPVVDDTVDFPETAAASLRSEERRVGKEGTTQGAARPEKNQAYDTRLTCL